MHTLRMFFFFPVLLIAQEGIFFIPRQVELMKGLKDQDPSLRRFSPPPSKAEHRLANGTGNHQALAPNGLHWNPPEDLAEVGILIIYRISCHPGDIWGTSVVLDSVRNLIISAIPCHQRPWSGKWKWHCVSWTRAPRFVFESLKS